jgi:NADPH:quinone reductase-like Zn-dependent oxidoreductase
VTDGFESAISIALRWQSSTRGEATSPLFSTISDIAHWIEGGQRVLSVAARFPLYETAAAHQAVERGDKIGTVVIDCKR